MTVRLPCLAHYDSCQSAAYPRIGRRPFKVGLQTAAAFGPYSKALDAVAVLDSEAERKLMCQLRPLGPSRRPPGGWRASKAGPVYEGHPCVSAIEGCHSPPGAAWTGGQSRI